MHVGVLKFRSASNFGLRCSLCCLGLKGLAFTRCWNSRAQRVGRNVGAVIIRIGFGGPLYSNDDKEPPIVQVIIEAPIYSLFFNKRARKSSNCLDRANI